MGYRKLFYVLPVVAALAACGTAHSGTTSSSSSSGAGSGAASQGPGTALAVTYKASESAQAKTWTLTCDPTGGDHPAAARACALLAAAKAAGRNPFAPVKQGTMCTMIFSGPQTATVTGSWNGTKVNATFSRTNGCQTGRWNALATLLSGT